MSEWWKLILGVACLAVALGLMSAGTETEQQKAHRKQMAALRRHRRQQDKEEKRVRKLWKERGKIIRPLASRNLRKSNPWF